MLSQSIRKVRWTSFRSTSKVGPIKSTYRAVTATFRRNVCHLLERPPLTVTSCCQQWLEYNACAVNCPANRCPLCNALWYDRPRIVIRGLDNLTTIAQAVRQDLGTQHTHSPHSSLSDDSDFCQVQSLDQELPRLYIYKYGA